MGLYLFKHYFPFTILQASYTGVMHLLELVLFAVGAVYEPC